MLGNGNACYSPQEKNNICDNFEWDFFLKKAPLSDTYFPHENIVFNDLEPIKTSSLSELSEWYRSPYYIWVVSPNELPFLLNHKTVSKYDQASTVRKWATSLLEMSLIKNNLFLCLIKSLFWGLKTLVGSQHVLRANPFVELFSRQIAWVDSGFPQRRAVFESLLWDFCRL